MTENERFNIFLDSLEDEPYSVEPILADTVRQVWKTINKTSIELPIAYSGGELEYKFIWHSDNEYIVIEFDRYNNFEWFYKNSTEILGTEDNQIKELPEILLEKIRKFKYKEVNND